MTDAGDAGPTVRTELGQVRGVAHEWGNMFLGIPYAAPATGSLRFMAPQPPEPWSGTRDCTAFGPACPQLEPASSLCRPIGRPEPQDENCLTLNVWTPGDGGDRLPVMVWIHGGAIEWGSASQRVYDGRAFARDGVVFVSVQYRLGMFGFLALDEIDERLAGSGNNGLRDQLAALRWVQENIGAFGGDPGNVTVFGESAGAMVLATHLADPAASGLFRRVILQSGTYYGRSPEAAGLIARRAIELLDVAPTLEALQSVPPARLAEVGRSLAAELPALLKDTDDDIPLPFSPVVDGVVYHQDPITALESGVSRDVDLMVGWCDDELALLVPDLPAAALDAWTDAGLETVAETLGTTVEAVSSAYRAAYPELTQRRAAIRAISHGQFAVPMLRLAMAHHASQGALFVYRFGWPTPVFDGCLGSPHVLDVPFVFDCLEEPELHGQNPPAQLASLMHKAWVTFAKDGSPSLTDDLVWPAFSDDAPAATCFGEETVVGQPLEGDLARLWRAYGVHEHGDDTGFGDHRVLRLPGGRQPLPG